MLYLLSKQFTMRISNNLILKVLYILSWIIFVGICIEAGAIIFNAGYILVADLESARRLWRIVDLTSLYDFDRGYFFVQNLIISIVAVMRAIIFYLIIKMLHEKKLDLARPFNRDVSRFIMNVAGLALLIGLFSVSGGKMATWFEEQGVLMPDLEQMRIGGADVWLFMSVILFVIGQVIRKGIGLQEENELTV